MITFFDFTGKARDDLVWWYMHDGSVTKAVLRNVPSDDVVGHFIRRAERLEGLVIVDSPALTECDKICAGLLGRDNIHTIEITQSSISSVLPFAELIGTTGLRSLSITGKDISDAQVLYDANARLPADQRLAHLIIN
jgi:hypothetical protein